MQPPSRSSLCRGGSDWERIKILEVNQDGTSQELNDTLGNVKFSATAWAPNSKVIRLACQSLTGRPETLSLADSCPGCLMPCAAAWGPNCMAQTCRPKQLCMPCYQTLLLRQRPIG